MDAPLAVGGNRLAWDELPVRVRAAIESAAGSPVREAISQPGGFSPGLASVLRLRDGRSVFAKAVNPARNPHSPGLHRREARILAALTGKAPVPGLLWSYDDGDWVALLTEAVDGRNPELPWRPAELAAYLDLVGRLAEQLTPPPVDAPPIQEYLAEDFTGWRRLAAAGACGDLDPWAARHLPQLGRLEQGWQRAAAGRTLLHLDLRADNVLLTGDGAVAVDWPHACIGAAWIDLLVALPSIAMHGGDPEQLWQRHPPARAADPDAVSSVLAALTGFFLSQARLPAPPGLPRVRAFQRAQGEAGLAWLRRRLARPREATEAADH